MKLRMEAMTEVQMEYQTETQAVSKQVSHRKTFFICLTAFLVAAFGMFLIYLSDEIYPGSNRTTFAFDMRAQFLAFFTSLRYIGTSDNSIFFNWSRTLGGNYLGLFAYYVASPLSWIINLFDIPHLSEGIWLLTILKIGLCGLTFAFFLETEFAEKKGSFYTVIFSSCYALMSYNMVYSMSLMWIDGVIFLPLILAGIEKMIRGEKGGFYLLSLTALFYSSFYISYMVGVFAALYLSYRLFCILGRDNRKTCVRIVMRFFINSLLALGLAAPMLLPSLKSLETGKIAVGQERVEETFYYSFEKAFPKLLPAQYDSIIEQEGLPSIYCGTVIVLLCILFFCQKSQGFRKKVGVAVGIGFLLISFWSVELDRLWHGFQYPNGFPKRYAFVFSTVLILVAFRAFECFNFQKSTLWRMAVKICCLYTLAELFLNGSVVTKEADFETYYSLRYEYDDVVEDVLPLLKKVKTLDEGLYRLEKDFHFTLNDAMLFGYNGIASSTSSYHVKALNAQDRLGIAASNVVTSDESGSTLLTDSLYGLKYRMMRYPVTKEWEMLDSHGFTKLYENPYALAIGFGAKMDADADLVWSENPFENQNLWLQSLCGTKSAYYQPVKYMCQQKPGECVITYLAVEEGPVYLRVLGEKRKKEGEYDSLYLINGANYGKYFFGDNYGNLFLGDLQVGEEVKVDIIYDNTEILLTDIYMVREDTELLLESLQNLAKGNMEIHDHQNGRLTGVVTIQEGQELFTTIPYDEGFTVLVDGERVEYTDFDDTFLTVPMSPGTHQVEIGYISPGFREGVGIGCATLILTWIYYFGAKFTCIDKIFLRNNR